MSHGMVFLGFGKYVRADRIYALEPIVGDDRLGDPLDPDERPAAAAAVVASRTQETILAEIEAAADPGGGRRRRSGRGGLTRHPQLFEPPE